MDVIERMFLLLDYEAKSIYFEKQDLLMLYLKDHPLRSAEVLCKKEGFRKLTESRLIFLFTVSYRKII